MFTKATLNFWDNARDSMLHALEHAAELTETKTNQFHHKKWFILSVHHMAECFLKILLKCVDPTASLRREKDGHYHPVSKLLKCLYANIEKLTPPERRILNLIESLEEQRHLIMHRELPDKLDPSVAAFSILAILRTCSRRFGFSVEEIFEQYPPIQNQLVELICWRKIKEYEDFITEALQEEFPDRRYFHECPYCGLSAIVDGKCICCFTEVITEECPYCEEEILIPSRDYGIAEIKCPSCGKAVL